jgi:hypothetical protein
MASTTTPLIGLFKATPGTNEPFRTSNINDNWDILDAYIVGYQDQFDGLVAETNEATAAAIDTFESAAAESINVFNAGAEDALDTFAESQVALDAAIASLDTAAILEELELGFAIDGGTA